MSFEVHFEIIPWCFLVGGVTQKAADWTGDSPVRSVEEDNLNLKTFFHHRKLRIFCETSSSLYSNKYNISGILDEAAFSVIVTTCFKKPRLIMKLCGCLLYVQLHE